MKRGIDSLTSMIEFGGKYGFFFSHAFTYKNECRRPKTNYENKQNFYVSKNSKNYIKCHNIVKPLLDKLY